MEQGDCPDTDYTLLQQGISNSQGKVEGYSQETDFALDQYGIASKEGKVESDYYSTPIQSAHGRWMAFSPPTIAILDAIP